MNMDSDHDMEVLIETTEVPFEVSEVSFEEIKIHAGASQVLAEVIKIPIDTSEVSVEVTEAPIKASEVAETDNNGQVYGDLVDRVLSESVLFNSLIWTHLAKYLNFADLKCLRVVCQNFNQNINELTNFKSRAFISMKAYRIEEEIFKPTTTWKHFKIESFKVGDDVQEEEDADECVTDGCDEDLENENEEESMSQDEESSAISENSEAGEEMSQDEDDDIRKIRNFFIKDMCKEDNESSMKEDKTKIPNLDWMYEVVKDAESLTVITPFDAGTDFIMPDLKTLLESPTKLSSLSLDVHTIDINFPTAFEDMSQTLISTFENLTELHILPTPSTVGDLCTEVDYFSKAIFGLSAAMKNLKVFTVPKFVNETNSSGVKHLFDIVDVNKAHITALAAAEPHMWSIQGVNFRNVGLLLPSLVSLKLAINHMNRTKIENIIQFISARPLLLQLDLSILPTIPDEVFTLIPNLSSLKVLKLRTKGFDAQATISWSFLSKLEMLEEFQFVLGKNRSIAVPGIDVYSIVIHLPKLINKISIKEINCKHDTSTSIKHVLIDDLTQFNPRCVTVLNLSSCDSFVTDSVMKSICTEFLMLRKLDVSGSTMLTDYGIIGTLPQIVNQPVFSVKNLKGLRCLALARCNITDDTLFHGIQFLELNSLDLSDCDNITEEAIMAVIEHNPSLEILKTEVAVSMEFLLKFPRLKPDIDLDYWDDNESLLADSSFDSDEYSNSNVGDSSDDYYETDPESDTDGNEEEDMLEVEYAQDNPSPSDSSNESSEFDSSESESEGSTSTSSSSDA